MASYIGGGKRGRGENIRLLFPKIPHTQQQPLSATVQDRIIIFLRKQKKIFSCVACVIILKLNELQVL